MIDYKDFEVYPMITQYQLGLQLLLKVLMNRIHL